MGIENLIRAVLGVIVLAPFTMAPANTMTINHFTIGETDQDASYGS